MMSDYDRICQFENLYRSHIICRKGKRKKNEVIRYEMRLSERLTILSDRLKRRDYKMQDYYHFTIKEPKTREVFATHYEDRIIIRTICDEVIEPTLGPRLIYDNMACQKGKGTHLALNRLEKFLKDYQKKHGAVGYVLKCDIAKYFPNIDHEILKTKLDKVIHDKEVLALMYQYIDRYHSEGKEGIGIALGNQSSQWYAIYYLDSMDRYIKEVLRIKYYLRYMDDFILIHHDKDFLKNCQLLIEQYLRKELHLELNPKTEILRLKAGVEFLGWKCYLSDTGKVVRKLKRQSKLRVKRGIKAVSSKHNNGEITFEKVGQVLASYNGHLSHGDTYNFKYKIYKDMVLKRDRTQNSRK